MMRLALLLIVLASLVHAQPAALGTGSVGTGGEDLASVPDPIREDLMHGRWDAAVAKLELMATARPEDTDLWLLLAGVAHDRAGRSEEALAALRAIETNHVDSPWVAKARFRQAEIHRARGEYQAAEAIYEAAVRHLRSPERQGELAGIYLEYADDASTPPAVPTPGHRLDYDRAFQLYAKVLELEAPRDLRDKALYRMAHCMEQTGNHDVARQRFEIYLTEFDPTRQRPLPAGFVSGQQLWDARHRLGLAELNSGRGAQARRTFEDLADDLRAARKEGSLSAEEHTRIGDALYDLARTYGGGNDGAQLGTAAYQRFLDAHPTHIKSTVAAFAIAELWRGSGQLDDAAEAYRVVVERAAPATADTDVLAEHQRL
ncbi:MAG: tetratricopeptide repeat protein, partial [Planctomycetota bacterium]|nr:tetratricopeptide repeat protein [Planctomycetota bacterium]